MNNVYNVADWRLSLDYTYGNILTLKVPIGTTIGSEALMQSVVDRGKIVVTPYIPPENMAAKCRKQATANVIKHIYARIEEQVAQFGYVYTVYLQRNADVADEIIAEFEAKGFEVEYDPVAKHLKISW